MGQFVVFADFWVPWERKNIIAFYLQHKIPMFIIRILH